MLPKRSLQGKPCECWVILQGGSLPSKSVFCIVHAYFQSRRMGTECGIILGPIIRASSNNYLGCSTKQHYGSLGCLERPPSGGVEAIAGLPPIHLHLEKLAGRANYRVATLLDTHPLRALLSRAHAGGFKDAPHKRSIARMIVAQELNVKGAVMETNTRLPWTSVPLSQDSWVRGRAFSPELCQWRNLDSSSRHKCSAHSSDDVLHSCPCPYWGVLQSIQDRRIHRLQVW